jgi:hypothetical protein
VQADEAGDSLDDGGMSDVALELIERRSGDRVPATSTFEELRFGLSPDAPLEDGWYALRVTASAPWRLRGQAPEGSVGPSRVGDRYESLFRVGSAPLVLAIAACASKEDGLLPKLLMTFSEPVVAPDSLPVTVSVDGATASCTVYDPAGMMPAAYLGLTCTPAISRAAEVKVVLGAGLVAAASSKPVTDAVGSRELSVELPAPGSASDVCRTWRETRAPTDWPG